MAFIGFAALLGFSVCALLFNKPGLILPGFLILFILGGISTQIGGGALSDIKIEMHRDYIQRALRAFEQGNLGEAARDFAMAERYNPIPKEYLEIYSKCKH